jgi:hypothetical protein
VAARYLVRTVSERLNNGIAGSNLGLCMNICTLSPVVCFLKDGGSMLLRNVGTSPPHDAALQPRRPQSASNYIVCMASNGKIVMNGELERIWREAIMVCFKTLSHNVLRD